MEDAALSAVRHLLVRRRIHACHMRRRCHMRIRDVGHLLVRQEIKRHLHMLEEE